MGLIDNIQVNVNSLLGGINNSQLYKTVVLKLRDVLFELDISVPNTKYIIKWNYDLLGGTIHIPENCFLQFDGGSIFNGTLVGNDTQIIAYLEDDVIFRDVDLQGTFTRYNKLDFTISAEDYIVGEEEELVLAYKTITLGLGKESISFNTVVLQKIPILYYKITFDTMGGNTIEMIKVRKNTSTTLPTPIRSEYIFEGWYSNSEYTGSSYSGEYTPTAHITLYAKWRKIIYTVTFASNYENGTSSSIQVPSGDSINILFALTRTGYTFKGWTTNADGTGVGYEPGSSYTVTGNVTFYAKWQINQYNVIFNSNYPGTQDQIISVDYNTSISNIPFPQVSRTGYTFNKWNINLNGTGVNPANITENTTFYAQWTINRYTITLSANYAGGLNQTLQAEYGTELNSIQLPQISRTGYTFNKWNISQDGTGTNPSIITNDIILYALWLINRYTVTFNPNYSGALSSTTQVNYGTSLSNLTYPQYHRTGYTLLNWNINSEGTGTNPSVVTENITLHALWKRDVPNTLTMYSFRTPQTSNYESATRTTTLTKDTNTLVETSLKYHYIPVVTEIIVTKQEWGLNGIETITIGECVYDNINDRYVYKIEDSNLIDEEIKYN